MKGRLRNLGSVSFLVCPSFLFVELFLTGPSESLRLRLRMEPYSSELAKAYPLNKSDDWLRKRQGLALPVLPPTTPEARKFFFSQIRRFANEASLNGKQKIDFEKFAQEWNQTADGKERSYITVEVLSSYAKSWEKITNIRASEEIIAEQLTKIRESRQIFSAPDHSFPSYLTSDPMQIHPSQGVVDYFDFTTPSLLTDLSLSRPAVVENFLPPGSLFPVGDGANLLDVDIPDLQALPMWVFLFQVSIGNMTDFTLQR